jgi:hypothetical protein
MNWWQSTIWGIVLFLIGLAGGAKLGMQYMSCLEIRNEPRTVSYVGTYGLTCQSIQTALNKAIRKGGAIVLLNDATYVLGTNVLFMGPNVTLQGCSWDTVLDCSTIQSESDYDPTREVKKTIEKLVGQRCESLIKQDYNRICEKITDEITKSKLVKK